MISAELVYPKTKAHVELPEGLISGTLNGSVSGGGGLGLPFSGAGMISGDAGLTGASGGRGSWAGFSFGASGAMMNIN